MQIRRFIFVGIVIALLAALVALSKKQAEIARDTSCQGTLTCIAIAMQDYHERYGHFPPAFLAGKDGKPAHSWRILLLEFLDSQTFESYRFDEPWDGANNKKLVDKMPTCYACPADPESKANRQTNYFVVVGPDTAFPGFDTVKLDDIKRPHAKTLLVVEAVHQGVSWMEPKDLSFAKMSFKFNDPTQPSISSNHRREPGAVMADGSKVWLAGINPDRLRTMLLIK